jgi:DNA-binding MarR family transcriptional regulator
MSTKITLEKQLEGAVLSFHHRMIKELRKEALRFKITPAQLEVLRYIGEDVNPTMKSLAEKLNITPPSTTAIVETLTKKNLVKREMGAKDRRVIRVTLTPRAWKFFMVLKDKKLSIMQNLFKELNVKDQKELIRILSILTNTKE